MTPLRSRARRDGDRPARAPARGDPALTRRRTVQRQRAMTDSAAAESRARPAEIIFEVTEAVEGRYDARADRLQHLHAGRELGRPEGDGERRRAVLLRRGRGTARDSAASRPGRGHRGMKLPRDLSGGEVARWLARHCGYRVTRSRGSHMTVTLTAGGDQHQVTVPRHRNVRIGTLDAGRDHPRRGGVPRLAHASSTGHPIRLI